jgi:hypothetical protein
MSRSPAIRALASRVAVIAAVTAFAIVALGCGPSPVVSPSLSSPAFVTPSALPSDTAPSSSPDTSPSSPETSSSPSPATPAPTPTPTPTPAPTPGPTPTPKPTAKSSGNVSVDLCAKLTVAEVAAAVGVTPLTARPEPGDKQSGSCMYVSGDRAVAATSFLVSGGKQAMNVLAGQGEPVANLGDAALWIADRQTLYVRKGDSVMTIKLTPTIVPADQVKAKTVGLGRTAAPRW